MRSSDQISSPNCKCAYPYTGVLYFEAPSFSNLEKTTRYKDFENDLKTFFELYNFSVDLVSLSNPAESSSRYLEMRLEIFLLDQDCFNRTEISYLGFTLGNQTYKPRPHPTHPPNILVPIGLLVIIVKAMQKFPENQKGQMLALWEQQLVFLLLLLCYYFLWESTFSIGREEQSRATLLG
ncbi:hypothetical protein TIFTF001_004078 [Ficus carica]|uniref:Uncharacterized protein n=1 Tax=Ficus carica TaxID=3494 RepID=A0AA87ZBN3_FICCA|nr:hypothetical protein TIFTF001_004078 [Ficus carica]